ncbi:MAG: cofactor-independent phosphoglycerate mutase [Clostridia bacterium]|nr:cofactor-independent phosphoglycerate mutase [Clostridia bacterium]
MKYFVLIPDGMADRPCPGLGGKTPMEAAVKPNMDTLAKVSIGGTAMNVPAHMVPESDTANLAILSYDPAIYSKGRSPLEAVSMGLTLGDNDTAIRCNLVTLSEEEANYEDRHMLDHSADEISTAEADELVKALNEALPMAGRKLYTGVSYRHCLVWDGADDRYNFDRPHDIIGQRIGDHLPKAENGGAEFLAFMKAGYDVLNHHPVNEERRHRGLRPANSPWLWSPGKKPALPSFKEKWGLNGTIISAVDLIKGIGLCAGMNVVNVDGATGNYHTNYTGKADATIAAFKDGSDFVYVHVEAPDECGHRGELDVKVKAIEKIDTLILAPVLEYLKTCGEDFKILVLPDHPTPIEIRTHSHEAVPFFLYDSRKTADGMPVFTEANAEAMQNYIADGSTLLSLMIEK